MKTFIVIFLSVFISALIHSEIKAQNFKWVRSQTHNILFNPDFAGFPSASDNSGNSILASIENYKLSWSLNFIGDFSLKKYNSSGIILFNKIFRGKLLIDDIQTDNDRNIYIKGIFMDTLKIDSVNSVFNTGSGLNTNYFIIKLNESGGFIWSKNINAEIPGNYNLGTIKVKDNILLAGITGFSQSFIKKYDNAGNETQSISITGQSTLRISTIDMDHSGNIIAGGSCGGGNISFGGLQKTAPFTYNVFIAKINSPGNGVWAKFIQDVTFQNINLAVDRNGNTFAAGDLSGSFLFDTIQAQGNQWVYDFFLTKLDTSGHFLWVREVPYTATITGDVRKGRYDCFCFDIHDNVFFTGILRGSMNWGDNIVTTANGYSDMLILKYDQNGNILSGKVAGGPGSDRGDEISSDNMGNVFVSGNISSGASFDTISVSGSGNINSFLTKYFYSNNYGTISISMIVEGFYDSDSNSMQLSDTIKAFLRQSTAPFEITDSASNIIDKNSLQGEFKFYNAVDGDYYIVLKHRNSIETWSSELLSFSKGGLFNYGFIDSEKNAFGNNLKQVDTSPVRYAIYSGDTDQDGFTDLSDLVNILNDMNDFVTGYFPTDINGNNITDLADLILTNNNSIYFIQIVRP